MTSTEKFYAIVVILATVVLILGGSYISCSAAKNEDRLCFEKVKSSQDLMICKGKH
jgi:ATP/ADP translocase